MKSTLPMGPNANVPSANYIPLARIAVCVGSVGTRFGSLRLFSYQHVGYGNGESLTLGVMPNARHHREGLRSNGM